ncbi:unnamed protein product [Amoebophrya sp. A25]|nr:unnamed protein product [Amoebophrya sp. A25]|eukprot:GSA25T00013590001.1
MVYDFVGPYDRPFRGIREWWFGEHLPWDRAFPKAVFSTSFICAATADSLTLVAYVKSRFVAPIKGISNVPYISRHKEGNHTNRESDEGEIEIRGPVEIMIVDLDFYQLSPASASATAGTTSSKTSVLPSANKMSAETSSFLSNSENALGFKMRINYNWCMADLYGLLVQMNRRILPKVTKLREGLWYPPRTMSGIPAPNSRFVLPETTGKSQALVSKLLNSQFFRKKASSSSTSPSRSTFLNEQNDINGSNHQKVGFHLHRSQKYTQRMWSTASNTSEDVDVTSTGTGRHRVIASPSTTEVDPNDRTTILRRGRKNDDEDLVDKWENLFTEDVLFYGNPFGIGRAESVEEIRGEIFEKILDRAFDSYFVEPDIVVCEGEFCGIHAHLCASVWRKSSWLGVALDYDDQNYTRNHMSRTTTGRRKAVESPTSSTPSCMYRIRFALHLNIEKGEKIKDAYWLIDLLGAFKQMGRDLVADAKKLV